MLLRNLQCGLVNGTRMIVRAMHQKVLECEIMVGNRKGELIFIPRIPLYDRSNEYPWTMIRVQFPVRVCFAMTIHKGQGQSMHRVGIYVAQQMFAHGQLYVGVSRATLASRLKVFIEGESTMLKNICHEPECFDFWNLVLHVEDILNLVYCISVPHYLKRARKFHPNFSFSWTL